MNEWIKFMSNEGADAYATIIIWKCSNCGSCTGHKTNFCSNCGAYMRKEET